MAKGKKIDFKRVAMNTFTAGAAGAITQVITETVLPNNPDMVDYAMIAAGVILPEIVKHNDMVDTASTVLIGVGAYRMSERLDLAGKIGINTGAASVKGTKDFHQMGSSSGWKPTYHADRVKGDKGKSSDQAVM